MTVLQKPDHPIADRNGKADPVFYRWMLDVTRRVNTVEPAPDPEPEPASETRYMQGAGIAITGSDIKVISLRPLDDSGEGTFKLITRDQYGRLAGTADGSAADVPYDNTTSGLAATEVKAALDELSAEKLDDAPSDGNEYVRKDGAWEVASAASGTAYTQWNPRDKTSGFTLDVWGLVASESTSNVEGVRSVLSVSTGKHYCELRVTAVSTPFNCCFGLRRTDEAISTSFSSGQTVVARSDGTVLAGTSGATAGTGASFATGDTLMLAFDASTGSLWIGKNSVWMNSGDPAAGTGALFTGLSMTQPWHVYFAADNTAAQHTASAFFGASEFNYTVPSGFREGWYS